jgi:hypothetical protein
MDYRAVPGRARPGALIKTAIFVLTHSTIAMTLDGYRHLLPDGGDRTELAAAAQTLVPPDVTAAIFWLKNRDPSTGATG